jgi:hypothetical protein
MYTMKYNCFIQGLFRDTDCGSDYVSLNDNGQWTISWAENAKNII